MCDLFITALILIAGFIQLAEQLRVRWLEKEERAAQRRRGYGEDHRLRGRGAEPVCRNLLAEAQNSSDTLWMERIIVLDAAAHGVFFPGGERVFDEPDERQESEARVYEDDDSDYDPHDDDRCEGDEQEQGYRY